MKKPEIEKEQIQNYEKSLSSVIKKVEESKHKAITTVNKLLIELYWFIGETIITLQEKSKWGDGVVEKLSQDLRMRYPEMNGFSSRNLWDCKRFYLTYRDYSKLRTLFAEISWSHNLLLLNKTKTIEEKEFYLKMSIKERWSFREIQRQIDSAYFERFMLSQNTDKLMKIEQDKLAIPLDDIHRHLKDEYILEFLDLSETFVEKELRKAILNNLRDFFLEFGKNLSFVGEEYPLVVDGEEFRIDLLFFHRELKCLIPIELKIGEFKPEYVGKMQFYLAALDEQIKLVDENPSIGLILCRSQKDSVVRLTLSNANKPMKISVYQTKLPDKKLIQQQLERIKLPEKLLITED
ncbi:MAG: PDDEXK nuclease domain-containing protein [Candidatus Desantisbacteria bacterium]